MHGLVALIALHPFPQLVTDALNQLTCDNRFCSIDGDRSVMHRICTLHVVYEIHKSELLWFGQLTQQIPSIVLSMHPINSPETMVGFLISLHVELII